MLKAKEGFKIVSLVVLGITLLFIFPVIIDVIYNLGVYLGTVAREIGECMK